MPSSPVAPILLAFRTPAPPETAWAFVTEPDRIAEWFTDASPLGKIGDSYRLDFGEGSVVEGVVTAIRLGHSFSHTWAWADAGPSEPTLVTWTVRPTDAGSEIELLHGGWTEAGADDATRDDHEAYWSGYMDDLEGLLEGAAAG